MSENAEPEKKVASEPVESESNPAVHRPVKTPMYEAFHAERYYRQAQIKKIEEKTGNKLICYVAASGASITREDTIGIAELLHNIELNSNIDLLLHTGGGDIAAAEKIVSMLRKKAARFRVIVPDFAKSAGTLIATAADKIVMSDSSELGPIDPQFQLKGSDGITRWHSVSNYLQAYKDICNKLRENSDDAPAKVLLSKFEPTTVVQFEAICERARVLAENHLKRWMLQPNGGNYTKISSDLMNTSRWLAHDQMINSDDAKEMGLEIEYMDPMSETWRRYWSLYCLLRLALKDGGKLFEAAYASLPME